MIFTRRFGALAARPVFPAVEPAAERALVGELPFTDRTDVAYRAEDETAA
ncbi:MAG: hypothetical protein ACRDO1_18315 [Nocardioidaceae bacterium]